MFMNVKIMLISHRKGTIGNGIGQTFSWSGVLDAAADVYNGVCILL